MYLSGWGYWRFGRKKPIGSVHSNSLWFFHIGTRASRPWITLHISYCTYIYIPVHVIDVHTCTCASACDVCVGRAHSTEHDPLPGVCQRMPVCKLHKALLCVKYCCCHCLMTVCVCVSAQGSEWNASNLSELEAFGWVWDNYISILHVFVIQCVRRRLLL